MRLRLKSIIAITVGIILVFILFFFSLNAFLPKIVFVPTYEYIALKKSTDTIALSLYAFVNKLSADPENLMIDIPGIDIEDMSIELSENFYNYNLYSIIVDCHIVTPDTLETTTVNVGFGGNKLADCFIGQLEIECPIKTDNSEYLDSTCGVSESIISDIETITYLKSRGENIEPVGDGTYILRQTIGRGISFSTTKLPYAVTPTYQNIYLNKVQYGIGKSYSFDISSNSDYVGEVAIDLNGYSLGFITPVIEYKYKDHTGLEIAPKVLLIDGSKSTKDLFMESLRSVNKTQTQVKPSGVQSSARFFVWIISSDVI